MLEINRLNRTIGRCDQPFSSNDLHGRFTRTPLESKWYQKCFPMRFMAEQQRIIGKRILLVDDDPGAREAIKLLLTIDRHEVVEAPGGAEAIELLKSQPFDLAVLDYFMPGMHGSQVALRIRDIAPSLPTLMITAYLEKLTDSDKPVDAIIGKPFAIEELRRTIAKLLSWPVKASVQQKTARLQNPEPASRSGSENSEPARSPKKFPGC